jgi:hypothetical protein
MRQLVRLLMAGVGLLSCAQCTRPIRRVEDVQLVTTDIDHFWAVYPAAQRDTAQAAQIFRAQYFADASPGLREYHARKYQDNDQKFARAILRLPRYYASVRPTTLAIAGQKPRIVAALRRLQKLYPPVRFSHIYFVIGGFAGSTAQPPGLLIGADQTANGLGVDTAELSLVQRNRCAAVADMPYLVTHELIHNNQQPPDGTLLSAAIREGMADFIAELVTGSLGTDARLHMYGEAHERELWLAFKREMQTPVIKNWLYNPSQETPARPCDLGYYVGYKICQAYYVSTVDKQQAVANMLAVDDFPAFLQQSGYEAALARQQPEQ